MRLALASWLALCLAALSPFSATAAPGGKDRPAPQCAFSGASVEYQVKGTGGGFEVTVNPKLVTVFHVPSKLAQSFLSNQKDFSINLMSRSAAIWPLNETATGNLNLDTVDGLHISVTLKPGPLERAQAQVIFTSEREEERYQEEVEKRLLPLVRRQVARGLLAQFQARELGGIARTDDNVVIRLTRQIVIGDDTFVHFIVENRNDRAYRLTAVKALQGGKDLATRVEHDPPGEETGVLGITQKGGRAHGIVALPTRELRPGQPVELSFVEATAGGGGAPLTIAVRLD